jgi:hypothetical protein
LSDAVVVAVDLLPAAQKIPSSLDTRAAPLQNLLTLAESDEVVVRA